MSDVLKQFVGVLKYKLKLLPFIEFLVMIFSLTDSSYYILWASYQQILNLCSSDLKKKKQKHKSFTSNSYLAITQQSIAFLV